MDDFADTVIAQRISQISGVAQVTIGGEQKPAIRVQVDPAKLQTRGLTLEDVRGVLGIANTNAAKGSINGAQVEQVPLRHHRDVLVFPGQVAQFGRGDDRVADRQRHLLHPARGQIGELLAEPQFVQQIQRARVDRVAPEIAQEVRVLLQHGHLDAGPRQQQPQHDARRSSARDQTRRALRHDLLQMFSTVVE